MPLPTTILFGGLALFLFGVQLTRENLQKIAGERIRDVIHTMTENRLLGLLLGVVMTVMLQSSGATAVLLVGLGSSGLITTTQAMSVLLGAAIGTTFTVQLISFKIIEFGLPFLTLGFVLSLAFRKPFKSYGYTLMGFGFIFFGMKLMSDSTLAIRNAEVFQLIVSFFNTHWIWGILFGLALTLIFQNSAATVGFTMAVALSGHLTLEGSIALVLGANIGTCTTSFIASLAARPRGRQIAISYLFLKVLGVSIFVPFIGYFADLCRLTSPAISHQIANAHTLFNITIALAFLPFITAGSKVVQRIFPIVPDEGFKVRYLTPHALDTPPFAFAQATREILRNADIVLQMIKKSIVLFERYSQELVEEIHKMDDQVDILDREVRFFLAKLSQRDLTPTQASREVELISFASELENTGDIIDSNIIDLATKKNKKLLIFSHEGFNEIEEFHKQVVENFQLAISVFATRDRELAMKLLRHQEDLRIQEDKLRETHLDRLHRGLKETFATSSIHLDLLGNYRRINTAISSVAYQILDEHHHEAEQ